MSSFAHRPATLDDVGALSRIRAADWGSVEYWHQRIAGYLKGELHPQHALAARVVLVALDEVSVIGFIAGHLTRRFGCEGELEWLTVVPEHRRRGVAEGLLRALAAWFDAHGAASVCVDVDPQNAPAQSFYRKHGAQELRPHWLAWQNIATIAAATPAEDDAAGLDRE